VSDANVVKLLQPGSFADRLPRCCANERAPCWPKRSRPRWPNSSPRCRSEDRYWPARWFVTALPEREVMTGIGPSACVSSRARPWRCR